MTDETIGEAASIKAEDVTTCAAAIAKEDAEPKSKAPSKSNTIQKLLVRAKGASIAEIMAATGWQPHSVRAFLSGLRKKGGTLLRESRKDGETSYRIAS
jgi:hypothetical protein